MSTRNQRNIEKILPLLLFIVGLLVGAGIMYASPNTVRPEKTDTEVVTGPVKYNCELSNGTFKNGTCICPIEQELGETQASMYDKTNGFCQTTFGGPGGDAFAASVGQPYGGYQYWNSIIFGLCKKSGGSISDAVCICPAGENYDKNTGECK